MKISDTSSIIFGDLYLPDNSKIEQLRHKFDLPKCLTSKPQNQSLQMVNNQSPNSITMQSLPITKAKPLEQNHFKPTQINFSTEKFGQNQQPVPIVSAIKTPDEQWDKLCFSIKNCAKCELSYGRTHPVIDRGNRNAKWMFIGEAPGAEEDLQGLPFVGLSGQLLEKMISAMNLDLNHDIYITNVIKCRPPHNRNPQPSEIAACSDYLTSQINLVAPQIIITLGRIAAQSLLAIDTAIGKLRGNIYYYQQIPVIVTYHPAYLLRNPNAKKDAWADLQLALKTFSTISQ